MSKVYTSADQLIGNTPLLELRNLEAELGLEARLLAKLEYLNPAGSAKDRIAMAMIDDAEAQGLLKPGFTIIESTSGNTGIGLASVAARRGYRVIITMPDTMSMDKKRTRGRGESPGAGRRHGEQLAGRPVRQPRQSPGP